jgi:hypothetical protein
MNRGDHQPPPSVADKDINKVLLLLRLFVISGRREAACSCPGQYSIHRRSQYLLRNILTFSDNARTGRTAVRDSGCYLGRRYRPVESTQDAVAQIFTHLGVLPSTGCASHQFMLRPSFITFYEGITISSSVDDSGRQISTPD